MENSWFWTGTIRAERGWDGHDRERDGLRVRLPVVTLER